MDFLRLRKDRLFLIDTERDAPSIAIVAQRPLTKVFLLPPATWMLLATRNPEAGRLTDDQPKLRENNENETNKHARSKTTQAT